MSEPKTPAEVVESSNASPEDAQEIVKLRRENGELHGKVKQREQRIAELEDENGQLKRLPKEEKNLAPAPAPAQSKLSAWLY